MNIPAYIYCNNNLTGANIAHPAGINGLSKWRCKSNVKRSKDVYICSFS